MGVEVMSYEERGMNARVKKLRAQSENTAPEISPERALIVTETYKKESGKVSTPMLRALTFKNLMEQKTICINEGELIVGERGTGPQVTPTYPELCCHTIEDLDVISNREKISFKVSAETKKIQQQEIIPFWKDRSMRENIFKKMNQQWLDCYQAGLFTEFMEQRAPGHTVAGNKIYDTGMLDIMALIDKRLSESDRQESFLSAEQQEELKAMAICAKALISFAERHAAMAELIAETETDAVRKKELLQIAEVCRYIPAHSPRNMWEALQYYWFVHLGVITELNTWDAFCPGRLDQHLEPFIRKISNRER
jgi:trans-4-hydroxy-L-proline dehydratase